MGAYRIKAENSLTRTFTGFRQAAAHYVRATKPRVFVYGVEVHPPEGLTQAEIGDWLRAISAKPFIDKLRS